MATIFPRFPARGVTLVLLFALAGSVAPVAHAQTPPADGSHGDWTTYHRDNARSGYLPDMPDPQQLTKVWGVQLDGAVYAEPLVVGGRVLVATEGNSLYALDAGTGVVQWQTKIGPPVALDSLPCGNIDPLGITGTPVYDPSSGLLFAVAEVAGDNGPAHLLVGVAAASGEVKVRRAADPQGVDVKVHQQRAALALAGGMVYIAYGGLFGDCGEYHGWVVAARTDGAGDLLAYQVPTTREGGIWAPSGPAIDAGGRLFVSVGNGEATSGEWDHSDSVLRLSPDLKLEDGFAPKTWAADNSNDADLGSMGPVLLPDGLIFIAGKSGTGYLLKADELGGVGGQIAAATVCPAFGGAAVVASRVFVPCTDGLREVQVESGAKLRLGWRAPRGVNGSPVVGGNTVYTLDRNGTLYALNAGDGSVRATLDVGETPHFASPTLAGGRVFVGTTNGVIAAAAASSVARGSGEPIPWRSTA